MYQYHFNLNVLEVVLILKLRVAAYIRISKKEKEVNSISNQKDLIDYYIKNKENLGIYNYYVDNGYSGTDFDRPEFKRMLNDITHKRVDLVIVKDLSRLGRNYIEVGELLDSILPSYDVKLISINDNIDGLNDEEDSYLLKALLNIYNENYPRDISNKVKTALTTKKVNGEFVTSYAPYGYKKSRYEKNKIIIDTEAAKIVKMIFDNIERGLSKKEIVDILNKKKIRTPMEHIKNTNEGKKWNISMITGIIKNKVYTGDLIQQKQKRISFKNHKLIKTKEDELIITKNNHMEIISKEQFERVQDIIKHSVKVNSNNEYDIFSRYLKCAECDSNLTIRKSKEYTYYACSSHVRKRGCKNKQTIRKDILEEKVITEINNRQAKKIDKLNRKYIFDLINMIYLNKDGSVKIEFKRK